MRNWRRSGCGTLAGWGALLSGIAAVIGIIFTDLPPDSNENTSDSNENTSDSNENTSDSNENTSDSNNSKVTVKTVNRQLQCVSYCDDNDTAVQVTVVSFTFDTNLNKTLMKLLLESQHNESGCSFGLGDGLEFQDERTGKKYPDDRQSKFTLVARESRELIASYSFLPSPGSTYTLIPKDINCDGSSLYAPVYGDVQFHDLEG